MQLRAKISKGGKIAIPLYYRKLLKLKEGEEVLLYLENNTITLSSVRSALDKARQIVNQHFPKDMSLVDKLIAERRREAEREEAQYG